MSGPHETKLHARWGRPQTPSRIEFAATFLLTRRAPARCLYARTDLLNNAWLTAQRRQRTVPEISPETVAHLTVSQRSRLELRLRDLEEKLEDMDSKFEHNIGAMNELLQKNLKYLKHLA